MKKIKRLLATLLVLCLAASFVPGAAADGATSGVVSGAQVSNNASDNNYATRSSPMYSAMYENDSGALVRVECVGSAVLVEEWSASDTLLSSQSLTCELPLFGGFYSGENYNFLVFGQDNSQEDDSCEVMRVVKYSRDWERLSACSVSGVNTYVPFDAGSLHMTETNNSLYLHTCHTMYESADGLHHQANMTFVISQEDMTVKQSYYKVMNIAQAGYVSHSFNQFIQTDGAYVYRVDHGDAYPRAVTITKCSTNGSITDANYTYALTIQGYIGDNYTGVSVSGFELSSENCLIVGNSIDQSNSNVTSIQRNIFLAVTSQNLKDITFVWLTDYTDSGNITPYTPQLVKLNNSQFLILWEEYDKTTRAISTKLVTVNADGAILDQTETDLRLSDCQPIFTAANTVCWYVTDGKTVQLCTANPFQLTEITATPVTEPDPPTGFTDTTSTDYFYAPVVWAVEQGVTTGTSATTFSPSDACTRGQIITFLWRAAGSPAPVGSGTFGDVDADEYYADAAQRASEQGLDLSDGAFRPADPCTRATVAEYLYRLAGSPAVTAAADFTDVSAADGYADAVAWAVEQGVTTGTSATTFSPSDTCTRGQIVTFLYRALA